jgi:DNA-binding MarR family transcriptional regulator
MTELSRALDVTPRNITGLVDRLEAAGLVRRARHATDRRRTVVDLTPRGRRLCDDMLQDRRRLAAEVLGSFDGADLDAAQRVLGQVHDALEKRRPG